MDDNPKFNWLRFRFSLKSLFAMTTLAAPLLALLGYQREYVRQRLAARQNIVSQNGDVYDTLPRDTTRSTCGVALASEAACRSVKHATIPTIRTWLGDEPIDEIWVHTESQAQVARRLFPEAEVFVLE